MSYLISELWLCLSIASVLGGLIGWFLRGDNTSKLKEIEDRWRSRFSELEYSNHALINRLKQGGAFENKYKNLQVRLLRMNKAADLANQQLKFKQVSLSKLQHDLEQSNLKLIDKKSQINELVTQLSNIESQQNDGQIKTLITTPDQHEGMRKDRKNKMDDTAEIKKLTLQIDKKTALYATMKDKYEKLVKKTDEYKASLIDAESKLRVTTQMLKDQSGSSKNI